MSNREIYTCHSCFLQSLKVVKCTVALLCVLLHSFISAGSRKLQDPSASVSCQGCVVTYSNSAPNFEEQT
jgi:hypothetical protein